MQFVSQSTDPSFDWTAEATPGTADSLPSFAAAVKEEAIAEGGGRIQLWVQNVGIGDDERLELTGFRPYRDLWQLRVPLPAKMPEGYDPVEARPYKQSDEKEFLRVNNRAFAWHPEQGRLTSAGLHERFAEPWYDPAGFLVLEMEDRIAGFCWTKIHEKPQAGEIYAIAVDPDFAGRRLGLPLTHAGLEYLAGTRLKTGMLYVESDNVPANRVYRKLGFELHQVNRAYRAVLRG